MDALRKAELEKKKAAQRLEQTVEHAQLKEQTDGGKVSQPRTAPDITTEQPITRLDPNVVRSKEEIFAATAQMSLAPIYTKAASSGMAPSRRNASVHDTSEDLTINVLLDQVTPELSDDTMENAAVTDVERTLKTTALSMAEEPEIGADSPLDESFHDAIIDISRELPGIYDETIQGESFRSTEPERFYDETLPGVSAAQLARDLGEENQPTPVAAQTIFTATATTQATGGYKWKIIGGLSGVVAISLGIYIYFAVTPLVLKIPPNQLTGELELSRPPVIVNNLPTAPVVEAPVAPESGSGAAVPDQQTAVATTDITGEPPQIPPAVMPTPPAEATATGTELTEAEPADLQKQADMAAVVAPATAPPDIEAAPLELAPGLIKISRSKAPDDRGVLINEAYNDFKNHDYAAANEKYEEVLRIFPENRDALLGLGAIAMKEGDMARVQQVYTRLFKLDPTDKFARAVLVNLDGQADPVSRESALKIMINDDPDNAFLHFSLGNIYAVQSRWAEAQQAFFDAYSNESANADYALNLAVSLDRIGQTKTALEYYNKALQLADEQAGQFDSAKILARIQTLTTTNSN